jgi:hypothetical protein
MVSGLETETAVDRQIERHRYVRWYDRVFDIPTRPAPPVVVGFIEYEFEPEVHYGRHIESGIPIDTEQFIPDSDAGADHRLVLRGHGGARVLVEDLSGHDGTHASQCCNSKKGNKITSHRRLLSGRWRDPSDSMDRAGCSIRAIYISEADPVQVKTR